MRIYDNLRVAKALRGYLSVGSVVEAVQFFCNININFNINKIEKYE
jgi:hypothetical protein